MIAYRSLSCVLAVGVVASCSSRTTAADVTIGQRTLHVADGYDVELVAGPPIVERPISVSLDDQGHLYVTDSGGMSEKASKQLEIKPHRIRRIESTHGDGHFDMSIRVADHLMFPEGCLWYGGSLYVAAVPEILKFTDADGTALAVKQEVWYDGKTVTGCGNDLHGPYLGRDGWFYWCKGAFAEQHITLGNGKTLITKAGHILRSRPDGSMLEPVMTGGMDNPVGVTMLSNGERILSCTFFQNPAAGHRDGLIHAIYGGLYGKKHAVLDGHIATGDLMPLLVHEGAAAPCGLTTASDQLFGGGFGDNVLACYFNLHKVVRHELIADGATYRTKDTDLISCEHPDFHPTDVLEDADGSLLVVDTGGWYKICCPTSVLAKPDVLGAIYRIRKHDASKVEDPYGGKIAWASLKADQLAALLGDARPFVRRHAQALLRQQSAVAAIEALLKSNPVPAVTREAIWTLGGIDSPAARDASRPYIASSDEKAACAAIHVAGLWRDSKARVLLNAAVAAGKPAIARPAAEAIGRLGGDSMWLLGALARITPRELDSTGAPVTPATRILEHSLIYALIETNQVDALNLALKSDVAEQRRGALVALDQIAGSPLKAGQVIPLFDHANPSLRLTAAWVVSHRPEWGAAMVDYFQKRLASPGAAESDLVTLLSHLGKSPQIQELLAKTVSSNSAPSRKVALKAMAGAELTITPIPWLDSLAGLLPSSSGDELADAIATSLTLQQPKGGHKPMAAALLAVGQNRANAPEIRVMALQAGADLSAIDANLLADLLSMLKPSNSMEVRRGASAVLAKAKLTPAQFGDVAAALHDVGPLEIPRIIALFDKAPKDESLGLALVDGLKASPGRRSVRYDVLKPILARYSEKVQQAGADFLASLNTSAGEQAAHLDKLAAELPAGDARRGQAVFISSKVACINCHNIGYNGGHLGPDLTHIGAVRTKRDLLEAIVYPSASFVRGYEPVIVKLRDGDPLPGIVASETRSELILNTGPQETKRIPWTNIAEMRPSPVSLMPDGFEAILGKQDLADVLAFLMNK